LSILSATALVGVGSFAAGLLVPAPHLWLWGAGWQRRLPRPGDGQPGVDAPAQVILACSLPRRRPQPARVRPSARPAPAQRRQPPHDRLPG